MAKTRKLQVEIVGDPKSLEKAFGRSGKAADGFGRKSDRLGKTMRGVAKAGGLLVGALGAGIAGAATIGVKGLIADEKALALVESTLKSTKGAANVTKEEILDLSNAMQAQTGIGGDVIRTNQAMLLTFTKVKNGVGDGNRIFDRATRIMADMSVKTGTDMKSSALQLGKALNDPIKGIAALSRVGVQFNDIQIEQIREMVKAGDTMGAQKVILKELETQFGGTANAVGQTAAGQWARAKVAFEEVAKTATAALLPILTDIADWMNRKGIPALEKFVTATQKEFEKWSPRIAAAVDTVRAVAQRLVEWFDKNVKPIVKEFVDTWNVQLNRAKALWTKFGDDISRYLNAIMRIWGPIVSTGLKNIRDTFRIILALIRGDWGQAWDLMKGMAGRTLSTMGTVIKRSLTELLPAVVNLAAKIGVAIAAKIGEGLAGLGGKLFRLGRDAVVSMRDGVSSAIKAPANAAIGGINTMLHAIDRAMPVPDFLPTIPKLAEGDVVSRPTLAIIGEDGPEAVIPLSAKRRKRGQELMTKAASMLNLPGDYPGPSSGIRMLALGGIFGAGAGAAKSFGSSAVSSLTRASGGAGFDVVSGFAKRGLSAATGAIPFPRINSPVFDQVIRMVRDVLLEGLRQVFSRKDDWSFGELGKSLIWSRSQMGKPYVWGGGHAGWNYSLRGYDCLTGDSLVYGPDGCKRMDEIAAGDRVWSFVEGRREAHTVTRAWFAKRQEVFEIRTRRRKVLASENHPFLRLVVTKPSRGGFAGPAEWGVEWAKVKDLSPGDIVVQMGEAPPHEGEVDLDFAWLAGTIVGDGTIQDDGRHLRLCLFGAERERADLIIRERTSSSPHWRDDAGLVVSAKPLIEELEEVGISTARGHEKRIPGAVWTWPADAQRAFLDGYCDADGHRPKDAKRHGERTYASASPDLISEVRALHILLGDPVGNITVNRRTKPIIIRGVEVKNARPLYVFAVYPADSRDNQYDFRRRAGLREMLAQWGGAFHMASIRSITPMGERDTYDITVEGSHNFVAEGIVVHNCSGAASHAAKLAGADLAFPGTTMTLNPISRRGVGPFMFGFRGMESNNPRRQHMGWKIRDTWYQFGSPGRSGGTDAQWAYTSIPPGLPSYARGTPFVPETGLAMVHRGERITPAHENVPGRGGPPTVIVEQMVVRDDTDAQVVADGLGRYLQGAR